MSELLQDLGLGALFAFAALPLLAWTVRRARDFEAASRQRTLVVVLALDVSLFALPFVRHVLWRNPPVQVQLSVALLGPADNSPPPVDMAPALANASRRSVRPLEWVGAAWLGLAGIAGAAAAARTARLRRLLARTGTPRAEWLRVIDVSARDLGIRPPYVLCSEQAQVPFVSGLFRPTLVLPQRLLAALDPPAAALAIRHELVHLARLDHWQAFLVGALRLALPFHPSARWLQAQYTLAREEAVDAVVAPSAPSAYANLLVDAAALFGDGGQLVAMAGTDLAHRVSRLTDGSPLGRARAALPVIVFLGVAGVLSAVPSVAAPRPVLAQPISVPKEPVVENEEEPIELSPEVGTIPLMVGTQALLPIAGLERVAIGDTSIADAQAIGSNDLLIFATGEGKTTLLVWRDGGKRKSYLISVKERDPEALTLQVKHLLGPIQGVTVRRAGNEVRVEGEVHSAEDANRLDYVATRFPEVKSLVKVSVLASPQMPDAISQSDIMQTVLMHKPAIASCASAQRVSDPTASGTLVMRWTIGTDGKVTDLGPEPGTYAKAPLAECLSEEIAGWVFPPHRRAQAPVRFPFKF